jgi:hypothetical protein
VFHPAFIPSLFWDGKIARETTSQPSAAFYTIIPLFVHFRKPDAFAFLVESLPMCGTPVLQYCRGGVYPPVLAFSYSPTHGASLSSRSHFSGGFFIFCRALNLMACIIAAVAFYVLQQHGGEAFGPRFCKQYLPLMLMFVVKIFETNRLRWVLAWLSSSFRFRWMGPAPHI